MSMIHLWSSYPTKDADTARRLAVARSTWKNQHWWEAPVSDASLPRLWAEEGKALPYITDIFNQGCGQQYQEGDIVVYTNADICVHSKAALIIALAMQDTDACYGYRRDFGRIDSSIPDSDIANGHWYCGRDLFAFRVGWWRAHRDAMPAMLIGRECFDPVLGQLMDETNAGKPTVLPDLIYHERHGAVEGYWEHPNNRYRLRGQLHNLTLACRFFIKRGIPPAKYGVPNWIVPKLKI